MGPADKPATEARFLSGLPVFLLMLVVLALLLSGLGSLPLLVKPGLLKSYKNLEDAHRATGRMGLRVPTYFPEGIAWPPTMVVAQEEPYAALAVQFKSSQTGQPALHIIQSASPDYSSFLRFNMTEVREDLPIEIKGTQAMLRNGLCGPEVQCSRIWWHEPSSKGGMYVDVTMLDSPTALIHIAESMLGSPPTTP